MRSSPLTGRVAGSYDRSDYSASADKYVGPISGRNSAVRYSPRHGELSLISDDRVGRVSRPDEPVPISI
jgi:hypothetical protein